MTVRSVIVGLLAAVALASFGYVNDVWMFFSYIGGDLVPIYAFGLLLIGLLVVNPALHALRVPKFRAKEWVVILSMSFMGSVIAGSALLWQFPHPIITPIQEQAIKPGWKEKDLLQYVPDVMMVDAKPTPDDQIPDPVKDYMRGKAKHGETIAISDVPWSKWSRTLGFWFTVLGLGYVAGICAVVVVHRQWSKREHLSYPIVTFAGELIGGDEGGMFNRIFRNKAFWIGFGVSLLVLGINGLNKWYPSCPTIATQVNCSSFQQLSVLRPILKVPGAQNLLKIQFFFAAVGLAYFLSSEASFSLGISGWLYVLCAAPLVARGVDMNTDFLAGGLPSFMYFGAYVGMGIMVVYLGRRFYWAVLRRSVFVPVDRADVLPRELWAARIAIVACSVLVAVLWRVGGLHPLLAVGFVLLAGLLFLMIARVNAATGLFLIQPFWNPVGIILGVFGTVAIGPSALIILALLCTMVTIDPRIAVVPLAANALKLGELQKVKSGRLAGGMAVAIVAALVIGVLVTVFLLYNFGVAGMDSGGTNWALAVARMPFEMLKRNLDKLTEAQLDKATGTLTLSRLVLEGKPVKNFFTAVGIGLMLVIACSYLRLRFPRWPLHPVMFLVWGTPWMGEYAPSFLLAWVLKSLILKYGGQRSYIHARGFFVGLIAGEFGAAMLWAVVGVVYYLNTGQVGESYLVRP